jgi:hypothetical protein
MRNPFEGLFGGKRKELPPIQGMNEHVNDLFKTTGDEVRRVAVADAAERQRAREAAEQGAAAKNEMPRDLLDPVAGESVRNEWSASGELATARAARTAEQEMVAEEARKNLENVG